MYVIYSYFKFYSYNDIVLPKLPRNERYLILIKLSRYPNANLNPTYSFCIRMREYLNLYSHRAKNQYPKSIRICFISTPMQGI